MNQKYIDILKENLNILNLSVNWVNHSYEQTSTIGIKKEYAVDTFKDKGELTNMQLNGGAPWALWREI